MKVLEITEEEKQEFNEVFDEKKHVSLEELAPEVVDSRSDVKINGESVSDFDAVYAQIPQKNAVFGRVLLEMIEEKGVESNLSSTGFFIMAKKNYLHHVLQEKNIESPDTAVIASEKPVRNLENFLDLPLIAKKLKNLVEVELTKIESEEGLKEFAEGIEYGEDLIIFSEHTPGDKYRCLVTGDDVISLKDNTEGWKIKTDNLQYSNISTELEQRVLSTRKAIGANVAEVLVQGENVVDVNPNPDLALYTDVSGKNAFEKAGNVLGDNN